MLPITWGWEKMFVGRKNENVNLNETSWQSQAGSSNLILQQVYKVI